MADALRNGSANLEAMDAAPTYQGAMARLMVEQLGLKRGTVLDFGAGTGAYTRAAAAARSDWNLMALEPNRELHRHFSSSVVVHESLDGIQPASLDAVFSLNVFEHIEDDVGVLAQLASRCKPGAPLFILVPAHMALWSPMDNLVGHVRRYSMDELIKLGQAAGFKVAAKGWFDSTGYFATKGYRAATQAKLLRKTDGTVSKEQIKAFDRVFALAEPAFRSIRLPFGKNCWVRLIAP